MAQIVDTKKTVTVTVELDMSEVLYLRDVLQNSSCTAETDQDYVKRKSLYDLFDQVKQQELPNG